jgi:hypothetical protein
MKLYCIGCKKDQEARLTNGEEMYPHRQDLYSLPFWKCTECPAFVGCHHKTNTPTKPLGYLATKEIKQARMKIHDKLDPLWKSGKFSRREIYAKLSDRIGKTFHSAEIKSIEEADEVHKALTELTYEIR